eukprot:EG_transcript_33278
MWRPVLRAGPLQGATGLAADLAAQALEAYGRRRRSEPGAMEVDWRRAGVFAAVGAFFVGPFGMGRYLLYDALLPGHRMLREVPLKTAAELLIFTPITTAIGSSLNEYFKRDGSWESVKLRQHQEFRNLLCAAFSVKTVTTYIQLSFASTSMKFFSGLIFGLFLNVYTSWRINVRLHRNPG